MMLYYRDPLIRVKDQLQSEVSGILQRLRSSHLVCSDETRTRVDGVPAATLDIGAKILRLFLDFIPEPTAIHPNIFSVYPNRAKPQK
jgi:hypothetical protein